MFVNFVFSLHFCPAHRPRLAMDMDIHKYRPIHGYIHEYMHVWISDSSHPVDISMDIMLAPLLI